MITARRYWLHPRVLPREVLTIVVLFWIVVVSCSYFFTGGGWNQASRFDLVRAITEQSTLSIDAYHDNTGDKALWQGHYYSDKAPGTALLAVPFAAVARHVMRAFTNQESAILMAEARTSVLVCSTIPMALATIAIYLIARRLHCGRAGAIIAACAYGLGTPAWAYGTFFWGHALAAACLILGFGAVLEVERTDTLQPRAGLCLLIGVLLGWAVITEFTAAIPAVILGLLLLVRRPRRAPGQFRRRSFYRSLYVALGAIGPLAGLGVYNQLAFGSPWHLGYSSVQGFDMSQGFFGITSPDLEVLRKITIGKERGLLLLSPVLVLAPFGLFRLMRKPELRIAGIVMASIFLYYLLLNASYKYWDGGFSYGPRHVAAGLPFLCIGLAARSMRTRAGMFMLGPLALVSVLLTLLAVCTHPMTPPVNWPLLDIFLPAIRESRLSQNSDSFFNSGPTPSFNWGQLLGLHGTMSLAPLLLFWLLAGSALLWINRREA
jgi:hypothetical protein